MISIIIPVYNSELYLPKLFQSIVNQSNKDFEVVFVDDCSVDNSLKLLKGFSKECKNIFYIETKKIGVLRFLET